METQLVRLDKPYNIICSPQGRFALHIATLIVVEEQNVKNSNGADLGKNVVVRSHPIVSENRNLEGEAWTQFTLKDCMVVCREGDTDVLLSQLKRLMEFCEKKGAMFIDSLPLSFLIYDIKFYLPSDENGHIISDYEVCLEFDDGGNEGTCMVYSSKDSVFYFFAAFITHGALSNIGIDEDGAIRKLRRLCDGYIMALYVSGLRSITFTTKDKKYQGFVDKLNSKKTDE